MSYLLHHDVIPHRHFVLLSQIQNVLHTDSSVFKANDII